MRSRVTRQLQHFLDVAQATGPTREKISARSFVTGAPASDRVMVPDGFSPHDYAVFLLHVAAEIEHCLLVQYLFAAYSLGGPQVPRKRRTMVAKWQTVILGIAREEMGHLVTVQNLLKLIGGPLNLERNDFPWDIPFYPFPFALEPFSRPLLARYICIESPLIWPDNWAPQKEAIEKLGFGGGDGNYNRVGEIYDTLKLLLGDKTLMPDTLFHADTLSYQASFDEWGRGYAGGSRGAAGPGDTVPDVLIHTAYSRKTALDAIKAIADQGEAADNDPQTKPSHFERFMELYMELGAQDEIWGPCRRVISNPRAVGDRDAVPGTTFIENPESRIWANLLNLRYRMLLSYLAHSFRISGNEGPTAGLTRGAVLNRAFGEMYNLRALALILVTLPAGAPDKPERASPSFELPYSMALPILERDVWRRHIDMLEASEGLVAKACGTAGAAGDAFLESLRALDAKAIATFAAALREPISPGPAYGVGGRV